MTVKQDMAWVVVVPSDDLVQSAILSAKVLEKTGSAGSVAALVSNNVTTENMRLLNKTFDLVIFSDTTKTAKKTGFVNGRDQDLLLMSAMTLCIFSKMVVVQAGVLVQRNGDHLFEVTNQTTGKNCLLAIDKGGRDWRIVRIYPDSLAKFAKNGRSQNGRGPLAYLMDGREPGKFCQDVSSVMELKRYADKDLLYVKGTPAVAEAILTQIERPMELIRQLDLDQDPTDWVAVVGMACRFPEANSLQEYWDVLENGRNTCSGPPEHRTSLVDMDPEIRANFLKARIDEFDAGFFGICPSEAGYTDPQARLLLEVSWEAFEEAKINPDALRGTKSGIFYGSWLQEYREALTDALSVTTRSQDFFRKYLGNGFGCSAAKLSYFYGFTGPNIATESGCSSSMIAVDMAVKSLQRRECPVALACGSNLILYMTNHQKIWAVDGKSKTFDAGANGYARAEGIACLILKRYKDAVRDGDNIHGIIRGSATSQEGLSKSFGAPTVDSEYSAMRDALKRARVDPSQVDYLEAHATGTAVGDPIEAAAIVKAYSSEYMREEPLWIGSGKTNMGHSESCSGLAGLIKVMLSLKRELIPKHLNVTCVNPQVDFSPIQGQIPLEKVSWPRKEGRPRIAGVSSFGITGTDAHVIIQEAPGQLGMRDESPSSLECDKSPLVMEGHLLTISAKSEAALEKLTDLFRTHLESSSDAIQDIVFTANACRPHHPFRRAVVGGSKGEIIDKLAAGNIIANSKGRYSSDPKVIFTFPGKIGTMDMTPFRYLYQTVPYFRSVLDECDDIYRMTTGSSGSFLGSILSEDDDVTDKNSEFYLLLPTCQYALAKLWMHWGVQPHAVLGHCFGEMSALLVSGALELENYYKIIPVISHFFQCQKEVPADVMAIQADRSSVEAHIEQFLKNNQPPSSDDNNDPYASWIDVTSANSPDQTVVAGPPNVILQFRNFLKGKMLRCKIIPMGICAHSRAVEPGYIMARDQLNKMTFRPPSIPLISTATGKLVGDGELNGIHMYKVFRNSINFTDACKTVEERLGSDVFLEMSCNNALTKFTQDNLPNATCVASFRQSGNGVSSILSSVGELYTLGAGINWRLFYEEGRDIPQRVDLPHYPFQRKSYWIERKLRATDFDEAAKVAKRGKMVHPVLGVSVEPPACIQNMVLFQNDWFSGLLTEHQTKFIGDHVMGSRVIFPGACFLEMMLSAWKLATGEEKQEEVISVKNFKIHAPLLVEEELGTRVQCVVNLESKTISVYASDHGKTVPWRLHANAEISTNDDDDGMRGGGFGFGDKIGDAQQAAGKAACSAREFYAAAAKMGLKFGPDFKSIQSVHTEPGSGEIVAQVKLPSSRREDDNEDVGFLCHPILIDAMIQCFMAYRNPEMKRLHVPVQIGQFSVRPSKSMGVDEGTWYVHCTGKSVSLLDKDGVCVGRMTSPELVATSLESMLSSAECAAGTGKGRGGPSPVDIFDVTWQVSNFYQMGSDADGDAAKPCLERGVGGGDNARKLAEITESLEKYNEFSEAEAEMDQVMRRLCYLYVVRMLFELGWTPEVGPETARDMDWGIIPGLVPAFSHFLSYLRVPVEYLGGEQVEKEIEKIMKMPMIMNYAAMETIHECGMNLAGILTGTVSAHRILFGERNLAGHFYQTSRLAAFQPHMETLFKELAKIAYPVGSDGVLRILEVGAGTGAFPKRMIPELNRMGIRYEYHFTDISPTLVNKAGAELFSEADRKHFVFKALNLEVDPLSQGFPPEYFDMVVAMDVLHATKDLNKTLRHIAMVTRMGGWVILGETEKPVMEADICFGILEGYWLFEDGIRTTHCTVDSPTWLNLLEGQGFGGDQVSLLFCGSQMSVISAKKTTRKEDTAAAMTTTSSRDSWITFSHGGSGGGAMSKLVENIERMGARRASHVALDSQLAGQELESAVVGQLESVMGSLEGIVVWIMQDDDDEDKEADRSREFLELLLYISQYLVRAKLKVVPRLVVVTEGCWQITDQDELNGAFGGLAWGFMRNVRLELPGIVAKCVDLERATPAARIVDAITSELWVEDKETEVVYRKGLRHVRRLRQGEEPKIKDLDIPREGEFEILLPKSKVINDVGFVGVEEDGGADDLGRHQIKVEVRCVSLNFKDVLVVMKPSRDFEDIKSIGLDFSGVVTEVGGEVRRWKVGDAVFGCGWETGAMRSHVRIDEAGVIPVPNGMSFADAATLPAVFLTAWYCMVEVAGLGQGQTCLVHAASGGVGLAAIQVARILGARIIGTAGSEKKRRFLRSLGVEHVFNSRSLDFAQEVAKVTNGHGVDVVLNCLTGPGFKEASLEVCRDGGHFVEISKLDIWGKEEVCRRRPQVKYDIVDVSGLEKDVISDVLAKLSGLVECGQIEAIPYTAFPAGRLVDALTYLQKAKQIGKVVVNMPHTDHSGHRRDLAFNERSTYLISGGKGAIGFAVCKWMLGQGAKYVVLVGRNEASDEMKQEIEHLNQDTGCMIVCKELDISEYGQVKALISEISRDPLLPPLKGVHHCAGTLSDRLIAKQDWANFEHVFKTKVDGAWNLHRSTLSMSLDSFVLYSSAAATFGSVGQSNYVSGNAFMEHLAQFRHSLNLPAISLSYGIINAGLAENVQLSWTTPVSLDQGVNALERVLRDHKFKSNAVVGKFCFDNMIKTTPHIRNTFLEHIKFESASGGSSDKTIGRKGGKRADSSELQVSLVESFYNLSDSMERSKLVRKFVLAVLCETLGTDEEEIREDVEFTEMGMDSLMSIEFANKIYAGITQAGGGASGEGHFAAGSGISADVVDVEENGTLVKMTNFIAATLEDLESK